MVLAFSTSSSSAKAEELVGRLGLQILKLDLPHGGVGVGDGRKHGAAHGENLFQKRSTGGSFARETRRPWAARRRSETVLGGGTFSIAGFVPPLNPSGAH
jgi:hypothetical protein